MFRKQKEDMQEISKRLRERINKEKNKIIGMLKRKPRELRRETKIREKRWKEKKKEERYMRDEGIHKRIRK